MIDGLATETMVASTRIMKKPTNIAHRAFHGFAVGAVVSPHSRGRGRRAGWSGFEHLID